MQCWHLMNIETCHCLWGGSASRVSWWQGPWWAVSWYPEGDQHFIFIWWQGRDTPILTVTLLLTHSQICISPGRNILMKNYQLMFVLLCVCCRHKIHHRAKKGLSVSSRGGHARTKSPIQIIIDETRYVSNTEPYITIIRPPPSLASDLFINPVCLMLETLNKLVCVEFRI